MTRDQELPGSTGAKHFDSDKDWCHNYRVNSVYTNGVDGMKIWNRLSLRTRKRDVPSEFLYRAAGLDASHDVPLRQRLVFETDLRLHEDAHLVQAAQHSSRQRKAATHEQLLFSVHLSASLLRLIDGQG
jgi:hypothetical protein